MNPNPHRQRIIDGEALFTSGDYAQALSVFQEVLATDPFNADALNDAGLACGALDEVARAAFYFEQALRVNPSHANAFFGFLDLLIRAGDLELLVEAFLRYEGDVAESDEKIRYRDAILASGDGQSVTVSAYLNPGEAGGAAFSALERLHAEMQPQTYVQIGVGSGLALSMAGDDTSCIGVDPVLNIKVPLPLDARLFAEEADAFFDRHDLRSLLGGRPVDLALLNEASSFESGLRAFVHLEQASGPESVILIDRSSEPMTVLVECLLRSRPDLAIRPVHADVPGIVHVAGLDARSTLLASKLAEMPIS